MQINNNSNYNQPNFRQVNLVKVPKELFKKGTPALMCERCVREALESAVGQKSTGFFKKLLSILGIRIRSNQKLISILEYPGYSSIMTKLEQNGYSFSWFKQNTQSELDDSKYDDYYSFYVLTKDDKDKFLENIAYKKREIKEQIYNDVYERQQNNENMHEFKIVEMATSHLNEAFKETINGKEINEFVWEFNDYANLAEKLDV